MTFGLFGALFVSILGVRLFFDGIRGETPFAMRSLRLPAGLMVAGGLACQLPLVINLYALWLQQTYR